MTTHTPKGTGPKTKKKVPLLFPQRRWTRRQTESPARFPNTNQEHGHGTDDKSKPTTRNRNHLGGPLGKMSRQGKRGVREAATEKSEQSLLHHGRHVQGSLRTTVPGQHVEGTTTGPMPYARRPADTISSPTGGAPRKNENFNPGLKKCIPGGSKPCPQHRPAPTTVVHSLGGEGKGSEGNL